MKKIFLSTVAVIIKILATTILGLSFTHDFETYTRYVSRTNDISIGFLFFIFSIDLLTILIVANITKAFFIDVREKATWTVPKKIETYIVYSVITIALFWLADVSFIIEIKSHKTIHHVLTGMLLMDKYVVFLLISIAYILQIHKIQPTDKARLFLNYEKFKFKAIAGSKIFSWSKVFYKTGTAIGAYALLMFYINIITLFLYSNTVFFFLNVLICGAILLYLLLIALHQLNVIFSIYKQYANGKYEPH
jgi:hypothetical protein